METAEYEEPYVRLLKEFLQGAEWQQSLSIFAASHAKKFAGLQLEQNDAMHHHVRAPEGWQEGKWEESYQSPRISPESKSTEYSNDQYELFRSFQHWADKMLSRFVGQLGVSEEDLVNMLETRLQNSDVGTDADLRGDIEQLLDLVDSLQSFENFARWMEHTFARLCRDDDAQAQFLRAQLDLKEWDLQVALANSFVQSRQSGVLPERDHVLLPWAEAVITLREALEGLEHGVTDESEIDELYERLTYERINVEYLVAERLRDNDSVESQPIASTLASAGTTDHDETTLSRLLDTSGKVQLAISRQRALFLKDHPLLADSDYEAIYFRIREELEKEEVGSSLSQDGRLMLQTEFAILHTDWTVLDGLIEIVLLENALQRINQDIQQELQTPGSVEFHDYNMPSIILSANAQQQGMHRKGSRLHILTADDDLATMREVSQFIQSKGAPGSPKHPLSPGKLVTTPKEARKAIDEMQAKLRRITQQRELDNMRKRLEEEVRKAGAADMRLINRLASKVAQMEAMMLAENGEPLNLDIDSFATSSKGSNTQHKGSGFKGYRDDFDDTMSDATVEDNDDFDQEHQDTQNIASANAKSGKARVSRLQIEAHEPTDPDKLLEETERMRKKLLLRAAPTPYRVSPSNDGRRSQILLNSPKSSSFMGRSPSGSLFAANPKREVIVNPTSLRFLATNVYSHQKA